MASTIAVKLIGNLKFNTLATKILDQPSLAQDARFATNGSRVAHRKEVVDTITEILMQHDREYWLDKFTGHGYGTASWSGIQSAHQNGP